MNTKIYSAWHDMIKRCTNTEAPNYANYGGRGITVCDRWLKFSNFREDMEATMEPWLSLDRVDNNGNYEPSNCKWSTKSEQQSNNVRSKWWYIDGVKYASCAEAASELCVHETTIQNWCGLRSGNYSKPNCYTEPKYTTKVTI